MAASTGMTCHYRGYPTSTAERERILDGKPRHWRLWYDGTLVSNYEAPSKWVPPPSPRPAARGHGTKRVECELLDEALGECSRTSSASGGATTSTWSSPPITASSA